jgi:hypothetical protein
MPRISLPCLLFLLLLTTSGPALAWGTKGHRVIGAIAEANLTPAAKAAVASILQGEDFVAATTWADEMRGARDNPEFWRRITANWHYVNIDAGSDYAASPKNPQGDARLALDTFIAILLDQPVPAGPVRTGLEFYFGTLQDNDAELKRFALKFLMHVIADLQQPLHSGYAADRGGNAIAINWFGRRSNLHSLWDTLIVEQANLDEAALTRRLLNRIGSTPAIDLRYMESTTFDQWLQESTSLLARIHARNNPPDTGGANDFGAVYAAEFVPTMEQQLIRGGLRTAFVLNTLFGGWPIGTR